MPDDSLTIRERAVAAWPTAWQGQNLRDILVTLGYDVDRPWRELPKKDRDWILFTDEQPTVPVYAGYTPAETKRALKRKEEPSYQGTFTGARKYVLQTFATTQSAMMKRRVAQFLSSSDCPVCKGKRLKPEALSVTFAGMDIAEISRLPLKRPEWTCSSRISTARQGFRRSSGEGSGRAADHRRHVGASGGAARPRSGLSDARAQHADAVAGRTAAAAPGDAGPIQPVRGRVRPGRAVGRACIRRTPRRCCARLDRLKASGNSLFVVEHELDVVRQADWIVDVGPAAGEHGGEILYSGPLPGLADVTESRTRPYLFGETEKSCRRTASPRWLAEASGSDAQQS